MGICFFIHDGPFFGGLEGHVCVEGVVVFVVVDFDVETEDAFEGGEPAASLVGVPDGIVKVREFLEEEF